MKSPAAKLTLVTDALHRFLALRVFRNGAFTAHVRVF